MTAAIIDSTGLVVDHGCADAHANRKQRRLQRGMYRSCAHPGCDVAYSQCEIHHVQFTKHGGKTVMSNLVPLCKRHHHDVHDRNWQLTMTPERQLTWRRPDGAVDAIVDLLRLDGNEPPPPPPPADDGVEPPPRSRRGGPPPPTPADPATGGARQAGGGHPSIAADARPSLVDPPSDRGCPPAPPSCPPGSPRDRQPSLVQTDAA